MDRPARLELSDGQERFGHVVATRGDESGPGELAIFDEDSAPCVEQHFHDIADRLLPAAILVFEVRASRADAEVARVVETGEVEDHQVEDHDGAAADLFVEAEVSEV